jgi:hypothetical protein
MKLSAFVAIAAVIGGSFLIPNPAEARNGWVRGGCDNDGQCSYQKIIKKDWPFVTYKDNSPNAMWTKVADCQQWRFRVTHIDGRPFNKGWHEVMPGSIGETSLQNVCR